MPQPVSGMVQTRQWHGRTLMPSLFCKLDIVRVTFQDSGPAALGPLVRKGPDGLGQSWNLGDLAIYHLIP